MVNVLKYFENTDTKNFYSEKLLSNEEKEKGQIRILWGLIIERII